MIRMVTGKARRAPLAAARTCDYETRSATASDRAREPFSGSPAIHRAGEILQRAIRAGRILAAIVTNRLALATGAVRAKHASNATS
jgi:hypothetical protein